MSSSNEPKLLLEPTETERQENQRQTLHLDAGGATVNGHIGPGPDPGPDSDQAISTSNLSANDSRKENKKKKKKGRHGARNQHRHKLMVKWVASRFPDAFREAKDTTSLGQVDEGDEPNHHQPQPQPQLHSQHILDIAGGKGELSARLTLCHTLHVRMIDPRPADLYNVFHKTVFRSLPKKWQQKINSQNPNILEAAVHRRFRQLEQCFPSDGKAEFVIDELKRDDGLREVVEQASLLIGMHADGATEAIVDVALHYRKPFVVVPCCVFPNFFKHRFVPASSDISYNDDDQDDDDQSGKENYPNEAKKQIQMVPVRNHDQFCQYLALKDSHFVVETLPFQGRNQAIWWDGIYRDGDHDDGGGNDGKEEHL